jgi:amidase
MSRLCSASCKGGGPGDAYHIAPLPRGFESQLESTPALRIGVLEGHLGGGPVQPEIEAAITAIAETCERMHHHLVEFDVDLPYDEYVQATLDLWCVETAAAVAAISSGAASGPTDLPMEGLTASWVERGRALTAGDVVNALEILHHVSRRMALASGDLDVLLSATLPTLPLPLGIYDGGANLPAAWYFDSPIGMLERTTMVFNCTGQPAISLPLSSTPDGIPIGVHLAAGQGREDLLLSLAHSLEQAHPWSHRRPPFGVEFLQGLEQTSRSNGRDARA